MITKLTRRKMLRAGVALALPTGIVARAAVKKLETEKRFSALDEPPSRGFGKEKSYVIPSEEGIKIQYLEIVTPEIDALCRQYSEIYGVKFSKPNASFGNARTAKLESGGMIGIRKPLRDSETPVVRPYLLVEDIKSAVAAAAEAGGKIAMPPMEIPEHGMFAIVIHGGIECGFWQN